MTDKEFERIISFIVNEKVIRRLLDPAYQSDKLDDHDGSHPRDYAQNINLIKFFN
jgi:hypothetical protein